jgi:protein-tyrosine-phosphatase
VTAFPASRVPARPPRRRSAPAAQPGAASPSVPDDGFNLLFVCTGNTCRSPLAEALARTEAARRGWSSLQVASAGLSAAAGEAATRQAVAVAGRAGVDLGGHRSRPLTPALAEWADLILGMGPAHVAALQRLGAGEKAATLGDFAAGPQGGGVAVADPWGGGEAVYAETFQQLRQLVSEALDRLAPLLAP